MLQISRLLILSAFLGLSACKKGVPDIQNLRNLSGFSLNQTSVVVSHKLSPQFTVTGTCQEIFTDIEVSFDDGGTWSSVQQVASAASLDCQSSGTFSLSFSPGVGSLIRSGSLGASGIWKFRAISDLGNSDPLALTLMVPQKGQMILAGSNTTSSGSHKLTSRVGGSLNASAITSGYNLKSTVKAK